MDDYSNGSGSSDSGTDGPLPGYPRDEPDPFLRLLVDSFPAVQPDASLWDRIKARTPAVAGDRPELHPSQPAPSPTSRPVGRGPGRLGSMLGIAAVLLAIVGTLFVVEVVRSDPVVSASDGVVRHLANPSSGELAVTIVTAGDGSSIASPVSLPALSSSQTYQLWSLVGGEVVSVGVLGPDPANIPIRIEGEPAVLALTIEKAGGVAVSEADPIAVWQSS